jgi:hypothetical protein
MLQALVRQDWTALFGQLATVAHALVRATVDLQPNEQALSEAAWDLVLEILHEGSAKAAAPAVRIAH